MRTAILAPERVLGVALLDTNAAGLTPEEQASYKGMFDLWVEEGPTEELTTTFANIIIGDPVHNEVWKAKWKARPKDLMAQAAVATVEVEDLRPRLGEITCPAIVIHGEDDIPFPVALAEATAAGIPASGPVVVVPGGHAANLSHPEKVNEALAGFFATV
jgi:pimeloyl-ACP methyl ester carboxylesterase